MEKAVASGSTNGAAAATSSSNDEALRAKLTQLFTIMDEERKEAEAIRANRDELQQENEQLKETIAKLNYRIKHLTRSLEATDKK